MWRKVRGRSERQTGEQFYVSVSRFKEALTIYTDDKFELLEAVRKSSQRPTATDLAKGDIPKLDDEAEKPTVPETPGQQQKQKRQLLIQRSIRLAAARPRQRQGPGLSI